MKKSKEESSLKIALVNSSLYGGGAERFTVTLANRLSKEKNLRIYVITEAIKEHEYPLSDHVKRVCLLQDRRLLYDALKIYKFLIDKHINIIIGIGLYPNLVLCLANFNLKTKVIICERNAPKHDLLSWKSKLLRKILYPRSDYYVFQTEGAKRFYSKKIQNKSFIIHNPVRGDLPLKSNIYNKEIVAIARLRPQKNYPMLLKAFQLVYQKHSDYILRIFGEGDQKVLLEELAKKLKIEDAVVFEGFCLDVHDRIVNSDIFVMSSDFEGMPNALMEAMAMGFPVISTDCPAGGPAELIEHGENGLLVKVGDPIEMAEKINFLIENKEVKHCITKKAVLIRETHSEEEIVKQWNNILRLIVKFKWKSKKSE